MHMNRVLPVVLFIDWFFPRASWLAWLLGKFPPGIPANLADKIYFEPILATTKNRDIGYEYF